jgi:hypothetical protein
MLDHFRAAHSIQHRQSQIQIATPVWLSSDSTCFVNRRGSSSTGVRVSPPAPISHRELEFDEQRAFNPRVQGASPWRCPSLSVAMM